MYVTTVLVLAVGFAAVATLAVRSSAPEEPWFRLLGSLMPLSLLVSAVLAGLASG
jgi:hypothetical protein